MRVNDRYLSFYYVPDTEYMPIEIEKSKTALLIVDMQNEFVSRPVITEESSDIAKSEALRWEPFYKKCEEVII